MCKVDIEGENMGMRRKDREVTDFEIIKKIIEECEIIRIGLSDEDNYPYIVPLNFGYETEGKQIYFYIHGAMAGRKYELMQKNGVCSFEMDCGHKMELLHEYKEVTMRYKSLMGKAEIEFLTGQDKLHGIDRIMKRDERTCDYEYNKASVDHTAVIRLKVTEYSGKINPVSGNAE